MGTQQGRLHFLEPGNEQWDAIWKRLNDSLAAFNWGGIDDVCPITGEAWQYMGTHTSANGEVRHEFRHRYLPALGARVYAFLDNDTRFTIHQRRTEVAIAR